MICHKELAVQRVNWNPLYFFVKRVINICKMNEGMKIKSLVLINKNIIKNVILSVQNTTNSYQSIRSRQSYAYLISLFPHALSLDYLFHPSNPSSFYFHFILVSILSHLGVPLSFIRNMQLYCLY